MVACGIEGTRERAHGLVVPSHARERSRTRREVTRIDVKIPKGGRPECTYVRNLIKPDTVPEEDPVVAAVSGQVDLI